MTTDPAERSPQGSRSVKGIVALALIFGLAALGALTLLLVVKHGAEPLTIISNLPDFQLTASDGTPFGLEQLKGKASVVDFFFTRCQGPCPMMAREMGKLQELFSGTDKLRFVSISVDPTNDSCSVLRDYGKSVGADSTRWPFLTGDPEGITSLSENGFKLAASTWPVGHSTKFTLVDKLGRIRGYYDSTDPKAMKDLVDDIGRLFRSGEG